MGEFSYDDLGICYWNGSMGPLNIGVVGSGSGLKVLLDIIYSEAFREFLPEMRLSALSHVDGDIDFGHEIAAPIYETFEEMMQSHPDINLVVEMTGSLPMIMRIRQALPADVSLMDHREVVFFCGLHDMALVKGNYMNHLAHQRTLIQSIIDEIREDIFLLDKRGTLVDLNRTVWQRAGVPRKELLGKTCWHAARLRDGSEFCSQHDPACPFFKTLRSGKKEETLVTRVNGSGLLQYYRLYSYPIFDIRGNMSHIMVMHRDITARTQREKFQQKQDKFAVIGEMSTYLAHEIRNPLLAVGGFANSLLKSPDMTEKDKEKTQIIVEETMRLDRMLSNMLRFARPVRAHEGRVNIQDICQDVAELMAIGYGKRGYRMEVSVAADLPAVIGDADALKQCVVNLVKNSIEAMPDGGLVMMNLDLDSGGEVVLRVVDTGIGMNEQEQDKAFNPFFSTKEDGSGLGLVMIKKIIEEYGGQVGLASKIGEGTTVSLHLPPALDVEVTKHCDAIVD